MSTEERLRLARVVVTIRNDKEGVEMVKKAAMILMAQVIAGPASVYGRDSAGTREELWRTRGRRL